MQTKGLAPLFVGLLLLCAWLPCESVPFRMQESEQPTFRAEVNLVSLSVVVTDREGRPVTDLKKNDFQVFEDNVEQRIAVFASNEEPVAILFAVDTSGSTAAKMPRLRDEAARFVTRLHTRDSVAILSFGRTVRLLQDFSVDREEIAQTIRDISSGGWTLVYDAVWVGLKQLLRLVEQPKALVLFSDGVDSESKQASEQGTLELAQETFAPIYCLYFNTENDWPYAGKGRPPVVGPVPPAPRSQRRDFAHGRTYLEKLAQYSGGLLLEASRISELGPAFDRIVRDLATRYSIAYYSSNTKRDGKFRRVLLKMNKPGLVARTRPGYIVPNAEKE